MRKICCAAILILINTSGVFRADGQLQLTVSGNGSGVAFCWPTNAGEFILQWTFNLSPPISWQPFSAVRLAVGTNFAVAAQPTESQAFFRLASPPSTNILTLPASAIAGDSTVLNGNANPNGNGNSLAWFEYGLTTNYGLTTSEVGIGFGSNVFSLTVTALSPDTIYHFRLDAAGTGGNTFGSDATFTNTSLQAGQAAPSVQTLPPGYQNGFPNVYLFMADLNDNDASVTAKAYFDYGATTNYGSVTFPGGFGANDENLVIAEGVGGLISNATYHCRVVAFNNGGTSLGQDVSFVAP